VTTLRIATFNLENFDEPTDDREPTLVERIAVMRPQLLRLRADILCLQEIHGQERAGQPRQLLALEALLEGTPYADFHRASTLLKNSPDVYDQRNLVILSRFPLSDRRQIKEEKFSPLYKLITAQPPATEAKAIRWERPILYAKTEVEGKTLHLINLHLKSKIPADIPGQKLDAYTFRSASAWAEGSFISAMMRLGQATEVRSLIDEIFDQDANALIVVAGDFNATADEVSLQAIRGDVENHNNPALIGRVIVPCEQSVPESSRYSLIHHGKGEMIDHILVSRPLLSLYDHTEIHNEILHDESRAFALDKKFPESDHAPIVATFEL
jgi:endonuclease/exonuclease/phosphatase family metal-dependent hydrolase